MVESTSKLRMLARAAVLAGATLGLCLAVPGAAVRAQAEVYMYIDSDGDGDLEETMLSATTPPVSGKMPVLFVHGHDLENSDDSAFNFRKNWQQPLNGLTSFKATLDHGDNAWLDIEPYYIRLQQQDRSIVDDAADIEWTVEHILKRHDASHVPFTASPTTAVKIAIIGYSKGTISARCYLARLHTPAQATGPCHFGVSRGGFNPVSEFIAIAPPNHGLAANLVALLPVNPLVLMSVALKQLNNGYRHDCAQFLTQGSQSMNFIELLNGHDIEDSQPPVSAPPGWMPGTYDTEAPGSRPNGSASTSGTLYVALYADSTSTGGVLEARDLVGGSHPSDDCQGRVLAKNLAGDAYNIEVSAIPGQQPVDVHANSVHSPEVICLALYTVSRHQAPANPGALSCTMDGQTPLIPRPRPWWWVLVVLVVVAILLHVVWPLVRRTQ